ncbi:MAG: hypothetical protein GOU98_03155 [Candidatus Altiarchaeota archaeon]|nr:hypothetical protein [Candidatus Altiarchaeota archaeon]
MMGNFPDTFIHALGEDNQNILVIRHPAKLDADTLPQGITKVFAVSHGTDNIDLNMLKEKKIEFYRIATGAIDVAEFCVANAISLLRKIHMSSLEGWVKPEGKRLQGKTWGLVGLGLIGKELAQLLNKMGCKIKAYDPYVESEFVVKDLTELLDCDVISIHVPLNKKTVGMINKEFIGSFSGIFLDVSRGTIVDTHAVLDALQDGTLYGAALDVFPEEPYSGIPTKGMNLIATPHIASLTIDHWHDAARDIMQLISK